VANAPGDLLGGKASSDARDDTRVHEVRAHAMNAFQKWYDGLKRYSGFPARGTLSGALVVLERLKKSFDLNIDSHTARGGAQVLGASGAAVQRILEAFGETRPFLSEGGRTNRGLRGDIAGMLAAIGTARFETLSEAERAATLEQLQGFLVEKVKEYHNRQRIKFIFDPSRSTSQLIKELLDAASETGKRGAVAQYLVGAKLQIRFPALEVSNDSYSTADVQLGRHGDFLIGDTVFHVTVAPFPKVYEKCRANLQNGLRPYLLVAEDEEPGAKQNARLLLPGQLPVESIESFVSQNLEELSEFSRGERARQLFLLLTTYNERVNAVEIDKSLMIDIPENLARDANINAPQEHVKAVGEDFL